MELTTLLIDVEAEFEALTTLLPSFTLFQTARVREHLQSHLK